MINYDKEKNDMNWIAVNMHHYIATTLLLQNHTYKNISRNRRIHQVCPFSVHVLFHVQNFAFILNLF